MLLQRKQIGLSFNLLTLQYPYNHTRTILSMQLTLIPNTCCIYVYVIPFILFSSYLVTIL